MLLKAHDITKTYGSRSGSFRALSKVSLEVDSGEMVGLVGTSGSGKSTMASVICGLETADEGTITFLGESCDASVRVSKRPLAFRCALLQMQVVFQNPTSSFSPRMSIGRGIAEGIAYRGVPKASWEGLVADAMEAVGLPRSYMKKRPWELSGGECQRAAIARAIISNPRLILCDEPTSSLDVTIQAQIVHLLLRLCRERDMACLFISHDLSLVHGLCERVYVMEGGEVVEQGSSASVFENPRSDAARRLVASVVDL